MVKPLTTVTWFNYNSSRILNMVLESLEEAFSLDYSSLEVMIVDNCSTDESIEKVESFSSLQVEVIKPGRNTGLSYTNNVRPELRR